MSRLPEITVKIQYTYGTNEDVGEMEMNHWATLNIQEFTFPFYEMEPPSLSSSDLHRFEVTGKKTLELSY